MVLLLVFMQLTRDLFAIAKFLYSQARNFCLVIGFLINGTLCLTFALGLTVGLQR